MSARNLGSHLLVLLCFQLLYFSTACATCVTCVTCAPFKLWVLCLQLLYNCSSTCAIYISLLLFCSPCIACKFLCCTFVLQFRSSTNQHLNCTARRLCFRNTGGTVRACLYSEKINILCQYLLSLEKHMYAVDRGKECKC